MVELLFRQFSDKQAITQALNIPNAKGKTPIFYAIKSRNQELISLLIKQGADLKQKKAGLTPLLYALDHHANLDCLNLLLLKDALTAIDKSNHGVLWYAMYKYHGDREVLIPIIDQFKRCHVWFPDIYSVLFQGANQSIANQNIYLLLEEYLLEILGMDKVDVDDFTSGNWKNSSLEKGQVPTKIHQKKLLFSRHARERMQEREIVETDIHRLLNAYSSLDCSTNNQIMLLHETLGDRLLSVVAAYENNSITIITAYWKD